MNELIDSYINRSILYDLMLSLIIGGILYWLLHIGLIWCPPQVFIRNLLSDLSTVAFTSAGFILTILTVLITFKANSKKKEKVAEYDSALSLFFNTPLYSKSTSILKNCIKVLLMVALFSFLLKAFSLDINSNILFSIVITPLILITMALVRCVIILGKILKLQNIE